MATPRKLKIDKIVLYHVGEHGMDAAFLKDLLSGHTCEDVAIVTGVDAPTEGLHVCEDYLSMINNTEDQFAWWNHDESCPVCGGKGYYGKE